jgi:hypothetical protein
VGTTSKHRQGKARPTNDEPRERRKEEEGKERGRKSKTNVRDRDRVVKKSVHAKERKKVGL